MALQALLVARAQHPLWLALLVPLALQALQAQRVLLVLHLRLLGLLAPRGLRAPQEALGRRLRLLGLLGLQALVLLAPRALHPLWLALRGLQAQALQGQRVQLALLQLWLDLLAPRVLLAALV